MTAEEQGLLGSQYYAVTPIYPLAKTVADINMDELNVNGRTKDLTVIGYGRIRSGRLRAPRRGRTGPDRSRGCRTGEGLLLPVRSLQLRQGGRAGAQSRLRAWSLSASRRSTARKSATTGRNTTYHTPKDVITPEWDLTGAAEDLKLLLAVGYRVAQAAKFPEWKPGNEFKATREAMLRR